MRLNLNTEKALLFRITHISNVPWILKNGLHCRSSGVVDPHFVRIGNADLIEKRRSFSVPIDPAGVLSDYVPFYFTPRSIMLYKIVTGHNNTAILPRSEIVTIVACLKEIRDAGITAIFTDQHAVSILAHYFSDLESLNEIDWTILRESNFNHDPDDPGKVLRYQAEALVHGVLPCQQIAGIACYGKNEERTLNQFKEDANMDFGIVVRPYWFF